MRSPFLFVSLLVKVKLIVKVVEEAWEVLTLFLLIVEMCGRWTLSSLALEAQAKD